MADPTAIVPYDDPFDEELHTIENFLMGNDDYPTLAVTELPRPICSTSHFVPPTGNDDDDNVGLIADPNHPYSDPFFWNLYASTHNSESAQAGPSRIHEESHGRNGGGNSNVHNAIGNPIQLSVWPPPNAPYICSCCQVLREITHTNGNDVTKLEIHGRLGLICHAIREKYDIDSSSNQNHEYQMFDFCKESVGNVKQFLVQYCEERKRSGYIMLQDPLSIFYETLCVGLDWDNIGGDDFIQPSPTNSDIFIGDMEISPMEAINQTEEESNRVRATRSTLSAQRERTGKLTLKDFVKYFNMPIESAAKKVRICPTVMKKICRKHGLTRWPHRKIKSIERNIAKKAQLMTSEDAQERAQAQADVARLQQEIANIYAKFGG